METGSEQDRRESRSGMDGQVVSAGDSALDAFSRWSFFLCLAVRLVPGTGILGDAVCASLVMQASPECCTLSVAMAREEGGAVLPPLTDLREKQGLYSEREFMWEEKYN